MEEQNKERDLAGIVKIIDAILSQRRADVDEQNELNFMPSIPDDAEHPASTPIYWISKWVDYSDKYGFGYQLSDDTIGVIFNDLTKLLLLVNGK